MYAIRWNKKYCVTNPLDKMEILAMAFVHTVDNFSNANQMVKDGKNTVETYLNNT